MVLWGKHPQTPLRALSSPASSSQASIMIITITITLMLIIIPIMIATILILIILLVAGVSILQARKFVRFTIPQHDLVNNNTPCSTVHCGTAVRYIQDAAIWHPIAYSIILQHVNCYDMPWICILIVCYSMLRYALLIYMVYYLRIMICYATPNPRSSIVDVRGFDSSIILI